MKHDQLCEMDNNAASPHCRCAERAFLATASDEERQAWAGRRGYDTNLQSTWDLPPRRGLPPPDTG